MDQTMTREVFLETLQAEYSTWQNLLAEVGPERMTLPGVAGDYSVKDIIAHITWGEREMLGVVRAHALVGSELWGLSQEARNSSVFEANRQRELDDVLAEAQQVHHQLMDALQTLTDEDLNDPRRFPGMQDDWKPWFVIAGNTYRHYQEHAPDVRALLNQHAGA